jgi:hypothetical protein
MNGQEKTDKRANYDLQNITQKTKDRATGAPLKTGDDFRCSVRVPAPAPCCDTRRVVVKRNEHHINSEE